MQEPTEHAGELYQNHAIQEATKEEVASLGKELGIPMTENEVTLFHGKILKLTEHYDRVAELSGTVGDMPEVKYARTGGKKPRPEENQYKAWTYKCHIQGASQGALVGKRVAVKDNISLAGIPMMNGSHTMDTYVPRYDATVITRLLDAGATIVGKSGCEDFCFSGGSYTCITGPILNPHDKTRMVGGSSGGSAALLAAGEVDMAIGGDQGGSIRIPSSWCGVVGLKPTFGLVPYTGACPIEPTVDHLGPMARTVKDCAVMLEAMAGYDPLDPRQDKTTATKWDFTSQLTGQIQGKKIAMIREGFAACKEGVQEVVRSAVRRLEGLGVTVEEVSLPAHKDAGHIWAAQCFGGSYNTMMDSSFLPTGQPGFHDPDLQTHVFKMQQTRRREYSPILKVMMLHGLFMKKHYGNKFYGKAMNLVPWLTSEYDRVLDRFDVLVMPTLPHVAPKLPLANEPMTDTYEVALSMVDNTAPFDTTGHPALTINSGYLEDMPVGLMFIGRKFDDATVLNFAYALEQKLSTK